MVKTHYRNCNICEALCGLEIKYEDQQIISIKGDKADPFSKGHICPKAVALQDFHLDKDRLRFPVKKTPDGFVEITWEEALELVSTKIKSIQQKDGNDAIATYLGNPNAHNLGNQLFLPKFLRSLKTKNRYSASSVDQLPHHVAGKYMFGHNLLLPVPDIDRTDYLLIIGGNPFVSNGSMMTAPDVANRLKSIQQRGGKIVVVDPRRTETAKKADEHFFIRPESDVYLLLAMIHVLFKENKVDLGHLETVVEGLEELKKATDKYTPALAAAKTGIAAEAITRLALEMAAAKTAACYSRMGASTQTYGGLCLWLTNAFNIINGNCDREGGVMFPLPAFDPVLLNPKKGKPDRDLAYSRVRKLPKYYGEFPVSTLADEIETAGEGQIKALITIAGNPILSTPNGLRLEQAIKGLDFLVSIDIYITETSRHADVILPAATGIELPQFDVAFHNLAVRNTAKYAPPLFEKPPGVKYDWEILVALMEGITGEKHDGSTPEMLLDFGLKMGAYGKEGLSLKKLESEPHGIDLGGLKPCLLKRLQTNEGTVQLAAQAYLDDLERLDKEAFQEEDSFPFKMIGRRILRQHNTWTHNSPRLSKGRNDCTLMIHPEDAAGLALNAGEIIRVRSRVGQINVPIDITDEMMQGVVSLPQGFGSRKKTSMQVAATREGVSINDLTDELRVDALTGNAALNGVGVILEKITAVDAAA